MSEQTLPLARRWNTWDDRHPLEFSYPPLRLAIRPALYAASTNGYSDIPISQEGLRLGPRGIAGERLEASLDHAGTALDWRFAKPDPFTLKGSWRVTRHGEWGLRFWVVLVCAMRDKDGALLPWRWDAASGALSCAQGGERVVVTGERPPLLVTFHETPEAVAAEFEEEGYFTLTSRGTEGPVAVLRYHLDEMPDFAFAASIAHDTDAALSAARAALAAEAPPLAVLQDGRHAGALDAVRDITAWNTVFDRVNQRPYTALSRFWVARKFGGFGVWLDDVLYHALMAATLDGDLARENLEAVFAHRTAAGNLPCLVTGRDAWIDRSQPPIGAFILWTIAERLGDRSLARAFFPELLANHRWWRANRDGNGDGLYEYGTSPIGDALYQGTRLGARNESSMDNSPVHDEARLDPKAHTLDQADVGLNSLLALDAECLALLARELGESTLAEELDGFAQGLRRRIGEHLWDAERRIFANRLWDGRFVRSLAPTSFYPLLAGAASPEQVAALLGHLDDPALFGGRWRLPSVARGDPAYGDNVYWRGRVWPPLNFLVWHGLKRVGADDAARRLAADSMALFAESWRRRLCPENFNAESGAPDDQPDTDLFYGWGGLMPLMGAGAILDVTPWDGLAIDHDGADCHLGPILGPGGSLVVSSADGVLTLALNGRPVLRTDIKERHSHIAIERHATTLTLPPSHAGGSLGFPAIAAASVVAVRLGEEALAVSADASGTLQLALPAGAGGRLVVHVA